MKIVSANKKFKCIGYYLLIMFLTLSINLTSLGKSQVPDTVQKAPEVLTTVEPNKEKSLEEFQKEVKAQNKESLDIVKVFSNLLTLIFIMIVLAWIYNKYGKNLLSKALETKNLNKNAINILSTTPIGQNKYLHIVETGGERILIGATNTNISLIKNLSNSPEEKVVSNE